ncbi:MAG: ABC transporter ATP-binding protein [Hyphomicrobiales bacterium]|nr:MAG: ABC transporter ATP-binding protein [Hyphomicrobiales bacterium]
MTDLITVKDLHVSFESRAGRVEAVKGVSFRIRAGSCVAIVGESGSGKSVSAQAIMGILPDNARLEKGEILFADPRKAGEVVDLAALDPRSQGYRDIRGGRISIIFQEPMTSLSPLHTVGDQISEALRLHEKISKAEARMRCTELLELVRFPDPNRGFDTYPFELSGGLRQRAMIAMALVCGPALLIADEPTTALDVTVQAQILGLIRDLQKKLNMAVLLITHDMGVVANMAEEVVVVYRGEVMEMGAVEDIFQDPRHPYLRALMQAVPLVDADPSERLKPLRAIEPKTGHLMQARQQPQTQDSGPILSVRDLTRSFTIRSGAFSLSSKPQQKIIAVDHVNFDIQRGESLGLVGESGCGKTTIARMLMGAINPDSGEIVFNDDGNPVHLERLDDKALVPYRPRIQYIFQDPFGSLNPRMTVYNILTEPLGIHNRTKDGRGREMVMELMQLVGLDPRYLNRYPHSFSGGQRQRIGIARALALRPELIICDEPVSALDVSIQAQVLNLLKDLQSTLGLTYLFISHDLAVVNYIADRIAVMCRGHLVEIAPREALFSAPQHPYTKALLAAAPSPDLNNPLDFTVTRDGRMTEPKNWPSPYDARAGERPEFLDLGGGHFVRAHGDTVPA